MRTAGSEAIGKLMAKKASEHRHGWLRLHGPHALERVPAGAALLRSSVSTGAEGRLRAQRGARKEFRRRTGAIESIETDWRKLVERKDIDLIDIASPNDTHAEIAIAAAKAGKMVLCEKPLGRTAAEAEAMVDAVETAGVANMVWYNYRRVPAVVLLKQLIDEGRFGRIFHYRSQVPTGLDHLRRIFRRAAKACGGWMQPSPAAASPAICSPTASIWRYGSTAPSTEVTAMTETFIKERKHNLTGKVRDRQHRRRQRLSWPLRATVPWRSLKPLVTRAATRRSSRLRSMANMRPHSGTCMIFTVFSSSTIATKAACAAGRAFTSPTATIPT